jgi:1-acyl-sn-glycerol-3-phosphate acyltransferase
VPIDRESSSLGAMKAIIARLKLGKGVVIYPEGTRTATGRLGEIKGGFAVIARRACVPIMPVAIVGSYECWPRTKLLPRIGRVHLEFGRLITPEQIREMDDTTLLETYRAALVELDARARRERSHARPGLCGWKSSSSPGGLA